MGVVIYLLALFAVRFLQLLPLAWAAGLGRRVGALAWFINAPRRRLALDNLAQCLGAELSRAQLQAVARENFRRIGENACAAVKTASMEWPDLRRHVEWVGVERLLPVPTMSPQSLVVAFGSFGNFELYARAAQAIPAFRCLATYRALEQPLLNRLLQSLREKSGCRFFERRRDAQALRSAIEPRGILLGLLADHPEGGHSVSVPFFGRPCYTTTAPAVLALRYELPLFTVVCFRTGLARWRIECGEEIPTRHADGTPRPTDAIMADVNRAFETAIRRDPANWFWPRRRWRTSATPAPAGDELLEA
jgi:KDO2-lipid IV(A) lauroyltransferase